jgi:hypothetical protein
MRDPRELTMLIKAERMLAEATMLDEVKHNQATQAATNNQYSTMPLEAICAEPVAQLCEEIPHLHRWTFNGSLLDTLKAMASWNFDFISCSIWVKPQIGIKNFRRFINKFLVNGFCRICPFLYRSQRSWIERECTEHGQKPAVVRELIKNLRRGPSLEMHGRSFCQIVSGPFTVIKYSIPAKRQLSEVVLLSRFLELQTFLRSDEL